MQEYIKEILCCPLFKDIREGDIPQMLQCLGYSVNKFHKGDFIFMEQEAVDKIGVVLEGSVDMIKEDIWGNKTSLVRIGQNEVFGETFSCSMDSTALVSFAATTDCTVLFLPFSKVMHSCSMVCRFHHRMIENMVMLIAEKNKELMTKVEIVSKRTLREKLLAYLSMQAQTQGTKYFEIPLNRSELAEYLAADRSAMTRELSKMRDEGILDFDRNTFKLEV